MLNTPFLWAASKANLTALPRLGNKCVSQFWSIFSEFSVEIMTAAVESRQIPILETVEDIQDRREQVLNRFANFKEAARLRRKRLEDAKRYFQFKRDADEVETWINEKLQIACDESWKDPTNLQVNLKSKSF